MIFSEEGLNEGGESLGVDWGDRYVCGIRRYRGIKREYWRNGCKITNTDFFGMNPGPFNSNNFPSLAFLKEG